MKSRQTIHPTLTDAAPVVQACALRGRIVSIKRFEIHDGDGIRTTLFLKGCPLRCTWCHNPECISPDMQVSYNQKKCINCGECSSLCQTHRMHDGIHIFDRNQCARCGQCEKLCLGEAVQLYGRDVTVEEILPRLLEDKDFYTSSGGGVTISGGEPLLQADFAAEILRRLKANGISTAVDTCGSASRKAFDMIIPYTDVFLYDIKAIDEEVHKRCTGRSNALILNNIRYLGDCGRSIEVRIPFVPGMNDTEIERIGAFLKTVPSVRKISVLPYHVMSISKYESLGMECESHRYRIPSGNEVDAAVACLLSYGLNAVNGRRE